MKTQTTLLTLALLLLAFAPTASADDAPESMAPAAGENDPCPPNNNQTYNKAYCTVQGIERATATLGDKLLEGNGTVGAVKQWQNTVEACLGEDWENCPTMLKVLHH